MIELLSTLTGASSLRDVVDRANYAAQDKLARFMASGQRIISLRDRAKAAKSANLTSQGDALLAEVSGIQSRALTMMSQANDLRTKLATNPIWTNLSASKDAAVKAAALAADMGKIVGEMDANIKKVDAYAQAVSSVDGGSPGPALAGGAAIPAGLLVAGLCAAVGVAAFVRRGK